ncbi:hypothetical protein BpJC7_08610 [Weizmannia acidilactici]|uniref:Uncharacterized protein n=1 Tax=Weizmannia acidilactici TaxID=2607726 RepID=A0A5J4JGS8_9BACI|nr:hypothetical protein [Weizmannia acidilactici]GER66905.1 hypothetical protein BpJC4_13760 [Weizmannia acidilactici]GER69558.1 hypothetical protein BpJC7_08610 [Weizmannia acidilactici]GER72765.1 hypothetical protein BpPP18_08320 [Weizmannia acidilactici]
MAITIITLLALSAVLFVISFFHKDPARYLEKELEDLSLQFFQETYKIKKRLQVLEEELMAGDPFLPEKPSARIQVNEIVKNQVLALFKQGLSFEQIAKQSALPVQEVRLIISDYMN